jgi:hypothetical protein
VLALCLCSLYWMLGRRWRAFTPKAPLP